MALLKILLGNFEKASFVPLAQKAKRSTRQHMLEIQYGEARHPGEVRPDNEGAVEEYVGSSRKFPFLVSD